MPIVKMTNIGIADFRIFKDKNIKLGSLVTVIAGTNGTGKSNLLGIIGNCVELKTKTKKESFYKPRNFRTEFNEIFKGSLEFDTTKSNRIAIYFDDGDIRVCRTTWQNHKTRFRLIPETVSVRGQKKQSIKKEIPVIYLGLSRLFPIGEAKNTFCKSIVNLSAEAAQWIKEQTMYILNMTADCDKILDVSRIDIESIDRKIGIGFRTSSYDTLSNSAGQDNIGQILSAIWRFKELKDTMGNLFPGGILLVDELDATLHPSSQIKLLKLLVKQARNLDIQIIFTTHSMSLIEEVAKKTIHNVNETNGIELVYITTANEKLEVLLNPSIDQIKNELYSIIEPIAPKIKIYTEDEEARWFLRNLLKYLFADYASFVRIIDDMKVGCDSLIALYKVDPALFNDVIVILDGDSHNKIPKNSSGEKQDMHFLALPGKKSPEAILIDYLCCDSDDLEPFYSQQKLRESGFNITTIKSKQIEIEQDCDDKKKRDCRKEWFKTAKPFLEQGELFNLWVQSNKDLCSEFKQQFIESYNFIANNLRIKPIR